MSNKRVIPMSEYYPSKEENVLIDTNVLIKQFYPTNFDVNTDIDEVFKRLRKAKSTILLSSVQVSEFINRYIRIQFNYYKSTTGNEELSFKTGYRSTTDYTKHMNDILNILTTEVLPICKCINDRFEEMDACKLYRYGFSYDFNDALISEMASLYNATFITNDHDFLNYSFNGKLVTSNSLLLAMH